MSNPRAPWTDRVFELLGDGAWHDQAAVVAECSGLVPPGVAWRANELQRRSDARRHARKITTAADTAVYVASGQRRKVRESIKSQVELGHIQRRYVDGRPQLRLAVDAIRAAS